MYTRNIMGIRVSGKDISKEIKKDLQKKVSQVNREIIFSIIYVGQDPIIDNFIKYKQKFGADIGIRVVVHNFDADVEKNILVSEIKNISKNSDAVIVQLPLPKKFDVEIILNTVPFRKDVDILGDTAKKSFKKGSTKMFPPVTGAMIEVLKSQNYDIKNKNIVIFGHGNLVGKPFATWLDTQNISYNIITKETAGDRKRELLTHADLIVSGVGVPHIITADMVHNGVVLLDGGTSESGKKVIGDIDPSCYEKSLFYTPVPGGIGPLTIAVLYQNILKSILKDQ